MSDWQPIETAPRGGTEILCCDKHGDIMVLYYEDPYWHPLESEYYYTPTHWMPLPPKPE